MSLVSVVAHGLVRRDVGVREVLTRLIPVEPVDQCLLGLCFVCPTFVRIDEPAEPGHATFKRLDVLFVELFGALEVLPLVLVDAVLRPRRHPENADVVTGRRPVDAVCHPSPRALDLHLARATLDPGLCPPAWLLRRLRLDDRSKRAWRRRSARR